jgi:thymidylate kinase
MLVEVEGPRGAGKSTLITSLCAAGVEGMTFMAAAAAEENSTSSGWLLGAFMRTVAEPLPVREAVFMYGARTAARARISRSLQTQGVVVLSDRFSLSLHVEARLAGATQDEAQALVRMALGEAAPDMTILLDVGYQGHSARLVLEGREPQEAPEFLAHQAQFAQAYESVSTAKARIDTSGLTPAEVQATVIRELSVLWRA